MKPGTKKVCLEAGIPKVFANPSCSCYSRGQRKRATAKFRRSERNRMVELACKATLQSQILNRYYEIYLGVKEKFYVHQYCVC